MVQLPSMYDYWNSGQFTSFHEIVHKYGLTKNRFAFMWRHIHIGDVDDECISISIKNVCRKQ